MKHEEIQCQEWESIYGTLKSTLAEYGHEDAFGAGDFWVVDDNYGSPQHKVCVFKPSFLTRPMVTAIQRILMGQTLQWEVLLSFDDSNSKRHPDDLGLLVRAREVIEYLNTDRLRKLYGNEFQWGVYAVEG